MKQNRTRFRTFGIVWIKLADVGIHGNDHMMMLEKNNAEIAAVMSKWLDKALPTAAKKAQ